MNQKEKQILKIEQDFKDTLENELIKQQKENKQIKIKDIKLVGEATWEDKVNGNTLSENVFIVEKEIREIDENGKERTSELKNYYLGYKCIAGEISDGQIIYSDKFENFDLDKMEAVNKLLDSVTEEQIELNSFNKLQNKEIAEVLTAHFGRKISEEEVQKMLEEMNKSELEELQEEKENEKDKKKTDLPKKQIEKIKVNGIQKVDLNKLVDGKETLGKRLDLEQYDDLYAIDTDKVNEIDPKTKRNNTTYSLVGIDREGKAKVLNDEFEMDKSVGNNASREQTKIRADNTATRDNKDLSVYTRKSNGMSIGCENNKGYVDMFLYQKTLEENENVGIQIETSQTKIIPFETRDIMSRDKGIYQKDNVQDEIEESLTPEYTSKKSLNEYVMDIYNYENDEGEEKIKDIFTESEIEDKLLREIEKNKNELSIEQIIESVKQEMNQDAENLEKEHKL